MKHNKPLLIFLLFITSCTTYRDLHISKENGNKVRVQSHADPCCGLTGLRLIYSEKNTEHVIYFNWLEPPYAEKEVRTLRKKKVIESEKYQLVFDTARFTEPQFRERGLGDTAKYDVNDLLLSTQRVKPTILLNHIDSVLLFHTVQSLSDIDKNKIWLLNKAAGYIKGVRSFTYNYNGKKRIK